MISSSSDTLYIAKFKQSTWDCCLLPVPLFRAHSLCCFNRLVGVYSKLYRLLYWFHGGDAIELAAEIGGRVWCRGAPPMTWTGLYLDSNAHANSLSHGNNRNNVSGRISTGGSSVYQDNQSTHTYQGSSGCKSKLDSFCLHSWRICIPLCQTIKSLLLELLGNLWRLCEFHVIVERDVEGQTHFI